MGKAGAELNAGANEGGGTGLDSQHAAMLAWVDAIAPYGIFTTDTDLRIRTWNQWLASHSELTAQAVIGRALPDVFPDIRDRRLDVYFRRALEGELSVLSTALHKYLLPLRPSVRSNATSVMLQTVRIAPLMHGGTVVGTIATIEDVTQRELQAMILRKQQEHDRLLSSALALLLSSENPLQVATELFPKIAAPLKLEVYLNYLLNPDGTELRLHAAGGMTTEAKKAMAVIKIGEGAGGRAAAERKAHLIWNVQETDGEDTATIRHLGLRAYAGFPLLVGDRLLGTLAFGSYARDAIAPDEIEFLSTIAQYLAIAIERALRENALRQAQQRLSEHADELETKIAERTAKLHETIIQLESFSYTIAHDLRAPIRSLKGYSEILISDFAESIPSEGQALLHRLRRASDRLDALTRDLLAFSKIARQDVVLMGVDLDEVLDEVVMATPALHHGLTFNRPLGSVRANRTLLQQCFSNLFDNALKFARPGMPPRIVVRTELRENQAVPEEPSSGSAFNPSTLHREDETKPPSRPGLTPDLAAAARLGVRRIWIEDNGIGIAPQAHEKIFGIFERVSGLEHVEGTGIGLAIVARAVQQMGGTCGVESALGAGSRFWLELVNAPQCEATA